ncbi:MAG: type II secretion system protein [Bdellovibrionales bacterium]|nr:type II secretion system protein [Bdellovibrionales bacterium]
MYHQARVSTLVSAEHGETLLNVIVALAIIGTLGALGLPQLSRISASFDRLNAKTVLVQDIKQAQAKALTEGCRGVFQIQNSGQSYTYGCDYLPYDSDIPPAADTVSFSRVLPEGIAVTPSTQMIFNSRGLPVDAYDVISNVTVTLSDSSQGSAEQFATGTLYGTGLFVFN